MNYDALTIHRMIASCPRWYHRIELAPGIITPGVQDSPRNLSFLDEVGLPQDCSGMRVLDVGCRDGYFAFELERRGATVVGVDNIPAEETGFPIASAILGSKVTYHVENVHNVTPEKYGTFDLILFLGILYHLRNPLRVLDVMHRLIAPHGLFFVETEVIDNRLFLPDGTITPMETLSPTLLDVPLFQFYPGDTLNHDPTNVWAPNSAGLRAILYEAMFPVQKMVVFGYRGFSMSRVTYNKTTEFYRDLDTGVW
ncbi:MAG TPA: class I SAM-dependent methyltransferase [Aggregatilineales bacterium]|nr:methyltransferase domain-containing protein [Anaerolineales bacterium]HRE46825.1 class I SAM-dependent methyltransferase [Aggregatilineales bacterium]